MFPLIVPGVPGTELVVTDNVFIADVPQILLAETETFPLVEPAVVEIVFEEEEPVHPLGNVQIYEAASLTAAIL